MHKISQKSYDFSELKHLFCDFDGVFTDNSVYVDADGNETVKSSRAEGFGLRRLADSGVSCSIVSTETHPVAKARAKKLEIDISLNISNKAAFVIEWCKENAVDLPQVGFIGNDINDIEAMKLAGVAFCPNDAWPDAADASDYMTVRRGGSGVVREICDFITAKRASHD